MAELEVIERQSTTCPDVTILDCNGKVTMGEGSVKLRLEVRRCLEEEKTNILLNLSGVKYADSSGIGELVSSYTALSKEGGVLKLLHLTHKLSELLRITGYLPVFDTFTDEEQAVNSFN